MRETIRLIEGERKDNKVCMNVYTCVVLKRRAGNSDDGYQNYAETSWMSGVRVGEKDK